MNEPGTLSEIGHDLENGKITAGQNPTVVMDAGIASEDNVTWLKEHHYPHLVVSRNASRPNLPHELFDLTLNHLILLF